MNAETKSKQTEIGVIPKDWDVVPLNAEADILTGFPFEGKKYSRQGVKVLRGENVSRGFLRWDTEKRWSHAVDGLDRYFLAESDIVVGMDGSRLGQNRAKIRKSDLPLLLAQRVARIRAGPRLDQEFLYYNILGDRFFRHIEAFRTGTSIPHISSQQIGELRIPLPPLKEQRQISTILSAVDSKIKLNQQMNKTLESISKAIFKHWFIDFEFPNEGGKPYKSSGGEMLYRDRIGGEIPWDWEVKAFSDVIAVNPLRELKRGQDSKKVGMADLKPWQADIEGWTIEGYKSGPRFRNGDTLFARITPSLEHGKTAFVSVLEDGEVGFGSTEFIVMGKKMITSDLFVFHLARSQRVRDAAIGAMTGTSGRQRVPDNIFGNLYVTVPPVSLVERFDSIVSPMFTHIATNGMESKTLSRIRDSLLPNLMSGRIRIPCEAT
jgi:type I restriction enzyme S subunit